MKTFTDFIKAAAAAETNDDLLAVQAAVHKAFEKREISYHTLDVMTAVIYKIAEEGGYV